VLILFVFFLFSFVIFFFFLCIVSLNEKLSDESKRLRELEEQKRDLMSKRQQNAINMFRQKEALMKVFNDMAARRNWESLQKLTGKFVEGGNVNDALGSSSSASPLKLKPGEEEEAKNSSNNHGSNGKPVNLLEALKGLKKTVKPVSASSPQMKKSTNIDDYMKKQKANASRQHQ